MDVVTLGAALNGSAEYVNSHFKGGSNIQIVDNPDGTQTINASGEVSAEDAVARAEIAEMKDGETLDSFGDVETALGDKADTSTTYTKTEVDTALNAKADKSTTYTKTEVDTALDDKVDKETGKGLSTNDYTTAEKTKLAGIAEGAEVNEIESIKVNNTTINPDANKVVNITVPTTAADVSALPDTTKYAAALSLTINSSTYVITGQLKDQNGDNLGAAQTIDLPLESVVVGGSYNSQTKKVVLTLQNGNTIEFSVADLVSGLQTELSASNKLNPAYINYDSTHRAVSDTEKSTWNGKQNAIDSSHKLSADLVDDTNATNKFATAEELEQIQTNKNNILYAQKTGVKNIMDLSKYKGLNPSVVVGDNLVFHGVTWTISNSSGLTVSGASDSGGSYPTIYSATLPIGTYYLSGGDSTIELLTPTSQHESGQGLTIEITESTTQPYIIRGFVPPNTSITGTHNIKPMLRQVGDSTFEPYAMSNVELTAKEQTNETNILSIQQEIGDINTVLEEVL